MRKVLLYHKKNTVDRRIFPPTDYKQLWKEYGDCAGNSGNKLFIQACEQYLTKPDIEFTYLTDDMSADYINQEFDLILLPTANIFNTSPSVIAWLKRHTECFQKYKIPVIVLGAGAQADSYDKLWDLSAQMKETATEFIDSVYRTGGQFGLRGYFTEELFHTWGYKEAIVTGCPSFYQKGKGVQIQKGQIARQDFIPSINGELTLLTNKWWKKQFQLFEKSIFIDQCLFYDIFYNRKYIDENKLSIQKANELAARFTDLGLQLIQEDRIKLFYDVPVWNRFFSEEDISFSIGQRIHGNIAAMLNRVPAVVCVHDSRTRELAEFFEIPAISEPEKRQDIYEIYQEVNYDSFNRHFAEKFDNFENFMVSYGVSYDINDNHLFQEKVEEADFVFPEVIDREYLEELYCLRQKGRKTEFIQRIKRKLRM